LTARKPRPARWPPLLLAAAALLAALPVAPRAAVVDGALVLRAEGRAPVLEGRADEAFRRALDECFRRALLEALRSIAPERQSPRDLETWQETILTHGGDFVGAWRILAQEQRDGSMLLEAEVEVWGEKLARAARSSTAPAVSQAVRLVVLADPLPFEDGAAEEEVDAGSTAAAALEAEFARRGAIIVATADRAPWEQGAAGSLEENKVALAAAAAKRLEADAVLILQLARRGGSLSLAGQLVAVSSETTLGTSRVDVALKPEETLAEAFAPAAHRLAGALAAHLSAARSARARPPLP
jgi:hypothetical protein